MTTTIHSNGSKWAGEKPDSIDTLISVLARWRLDTDRFQDGFIHQEGGVTRFVGNFSRLSHVFRIETDDPKTIERLTAAIEGNAALAYDPVDAFYCAVVKKGPHEGRWHRQNERFEKVSQYRNDWQATGDHLSFKQMQALANRGIVSVY